MNKVKGFTLVELMIVVAIIGIVGAIAMPSYNKFMLHSHRADDGKVHLAKIIDRQERFYLQNNIYTTVFTAAGLNISQASPDGLYDFTVTLAGVPIGQGYTVVATAAGTQLNDVDCRTMTITSTGLRSATDDSGADSTTKCW